MAIRFDGRVAVVTGGGNGLGRSHCLQLANLGAKVAVNDLGGGVDGSGGSSAAARAVVDEINRQGGDAIARSCDVTQAADVRRMIGEVMAQWGRVDIVINNAGILRDKSFSKMTLGDFSAVLDTHLMGAVNCTQAAWDIMRGQNYGRVVFTSSGSGLFGNFGQANYAAAKMALIGLMNDLYHEGEKYNIRVNAIVPSAATRMTEGLAPAEILGKMGPDLVSPAVLFLVSENAPSKTILSAGAGAFSVTRICDSQGLYIGDSNLTVDDIAKNWPAIADPHGQHEVASAWEQTRKYMELRQRKEGK